MDDMATIEALEIPGEMAEAALRKARAAQMTLREYLLTLVAADVSRSLPPDHRELLVDGELPEPVSDETAADVAEFRDSIKGRVTNEDILAALHEGRPA